MYYIINMYDTHYTFASEQDLAHAYHVYWNFNWLHFPLCHNVLKHIII